MRMTLIWSWHNQKNAWLCASYNMEPWMKFLRSLTFYGKRTVKNILLKARLRPVEKTGGLFLLKEYSTYNPFLSAKLLLFALEEVTAAEKNDSHMSDLLIKVPGAK